MAKLKPLFTLQRMPGLKPVEIRVFDEEQKTVNEIIQSASLNVYEHEHTFIVTPLHLKELPNLEHLKEYNSLCEKRDKFFENLYSMGKANPKAVRLANEKKPGHGKNYWDAVRAYNTERFSKKPDPEKLKALFDKTVEMRKLHTDHLHRPVKNTAPVMHDEARFKEVQKLHHKAKEKFKASFRYLKSQGWNEKSIRKLYSKYGFN